VYITHYTQRVYITHYTHVTHYTQTMTRQQAIAICAPYHQRDEMVPYQHRHLPAKFKITEKELNEWEEDEDEMDEPEEVVITQKKSVTERSKVARNEAESGSLKKKRVNIYISEYALNKLKERAYEERTSVSALIESLA
jgi:predicted DNA binding CopG/RHH family protein